MDPTYLPGAPMTSIFEGQPPKTRTFPTKTKVIWGSRCICIYHIYHHLAVRVLFHKGMVYKTSSIHSEWKRYRVRWTQLCHWLRDKIIVKKSAPKRWTTLKIPGWTLQWRGEWTCMTFAGVFCIRPQNDATGLRGWVGFLGCFIYCSTSLKKSRLRDWAQLSNEKNLGWLFDIGNYTTWLYRDFNKPL